MRWVHGSCGSVILDKCIVCVSWLIAVGLKKTLININATFLLIVFLNIIIYILYYFSTFLFFIFNCDRHSYYNTISSLYHLAEMRSSAASTRVRQTKHTRATYVRVSFWPGGENHHQHTCRTCVVDRERTKSVACARRMQRDWGNGDQLMGFPTPKHALMFGSCASTDALRAVQRLHGARFGLNSIRIKR